MALDSGEAERLCDVCMDEKPSSQFFALSCGHYFCRSCWEDHLASAVESKGQEAVSGTLCPAAPVCSLVVDEATWRYLAKSEVRGNWAVAAPLMWVHCLRACFVELLADF